MNQSSPPACGGASRLTTADRDLIARARVLAALKGNALRLHSGERDPALAMATVLGECQGVLRQLAERLADLAGR